ncbi:MAG: hypothetical protein CL678_12330 [Bdellovibrionaceae bacterium]|nr:hypothetical protein [Pseudobdellovibrionaceae bacterium]
MQFVLISFFLTLITMGCDRPSADPFSFTSACLFIDEDFNLIEEEWLPIVKECNYPEHFDPNRDDPILLSQKCKDQLIEKIDFNFESFKLHQDQGDPFAEQAFENLLVAIQTLFFHPFYLTPNESLFTINGQTLDYPKIPESYEGEHFKESPRSSDIKLTPSDYNKKIVNLFCKRVKNAGLIYDSQFVTALAEAKTVDGNFYFGQNFGGRERSAKNRGILSISLYHELVHFLSEHERCYQRESSILPGSPYQVILQGDRPEETIVQPGDYRICTDAERSAKGLSAEAVCHSPVHSGCDANSDGTYQREASAYLSYVWGGLITGIENENTLIPIIPVHSDLPKSLLQKGCERLSHVNNPIKLYSLQNSFSCSIAAEDMMSEFLNQGRALSLPFFE